jgi:phenylacetate-coenzyme A ligase PaaK-like adenylate-forming protein
LNATSDNYTTACHAALDLALAQAPFYRSWRPLDPGPEVPVTRRFAALPVTTKRDLRSHMPHGFTHRPAELKAALAAGDVELVSTSGTTDDRSSVLWHQPWWDASERAAAGLHAGLAEVLARAPHEAVLTNPLCGATVCHVGDRPMAERTLGRLLFLNQQPDPNRWTAAECDRMIDELNRFQPELLEADPAYLAILAHYATTHGCTVHAPRFITLTYEFPARVQLRQIRRVFPGVPLVSSYGSTETGHVLTACECGNFHQNTASCRIDFQPLRSVRGQPRIGRILVTALNHPWLSLVRFEPGDLVRLADVPSMPDTTEWNCNGGRISATPDRTRRARPSNLDDIAPCPCGRREGLIVAAIVGRTRDLTFTTVGATVTVDQLDAATGAIEDLLAYRLEQTERDAYAFRFVSEAGAEARVQDAALASLAQLYGPDARITARRESVIAPEQSGKFRLARTTFAWVQDDLFDQ